MKKRSTEWHNQLKKSVYNDPESLAEYEAFKLQLALAEKMRIAREHAELTQENIAEKLRTHKSVISRLEAAGGQNKHSATIQTLVKYALAIGYTLEFRLKKKHR